MARWAESHRHGRRRHHPDAGRTAVRAGNHLLRHSAASTKRRRVVPVLDLFFWRGASPPAGGSPAGTVAAAPGLQVTPPGRGGPHGAARQASSRRIASASALARGVMLSTWQTSSGLWAFSPIGPVPQRVGAPIAGCSRNRPSRRCTRRRPSCRDRRPRRRSGRTGRGWPASARAAGRRRSLGDARRGARRGAVWRGRCDRGLGRGHRRHRLEAHVDPGLGLGRHGVDRRAALDQADIDGGAGGVVGQRVERQDLAAELLDRARRPCRARRRSGRARR